MTTLAFGLASQAQAKNKPEFRTNLVRQVEGQQTRIFLMDGFLGILYMYSRTSMA